MAKNKYFLVLFLIPLCINAVITVEQFKALSDDKKWNVYCEHIDNYRRIFKVKDGTILKLETKAEWWQDIAIGSMCVAIGATLLGVFTAYYAIKNPRAPRE